jgi:hypothetical protein
VKRVTKKKVTKGFISCLCLMLLTATSADGDQLRTGNIRIYSGSSLKVFCSQRGNDTYISFPGVPSWALLNDGKDYHAMPVEEVAEAVGSVEFPIEPIEMHILILPVPRRDLAESSAEGIVVFLSPGRVPYQNEHIHYTVTHEIGHIVQHVLMPDWRQDLWQRYAAFRQVGHSGQSAGDGHASRLHEIFAEDFRALFGGELARCGGRVENHDITPPDEVKGLREFFLSLIDEWNGLVRICAYPNHFRENVVLAARSLDTDVRMFETRIFDVKGRLVLAIRPDWPDGNQVIWDGRDRHGQSVAPGLYFASVLTDSGQRIHKIIRASR